MCVGSICVEIGLKLLIMMKSGKGTMEPLAAVIGSFHPFEGFEEQTGFSLTANVT